MKNEEIVKTLRRCDVKHCTGCPLLSKEGCIMALKDEAANLIEKLTDRCARYAEEIAVLQEREKWVPVTERLTQRLRTGEVLMASEYEEKYTEQEWISVLQDCLAAYEDTGLTPNDVTDMMAANGNAICEIVKLKEELQGAKNAVEQYAAINETLFDSNMKLGADRKALIDELCQYCGKYKQAHEGACDGCRWREM